MPLLPTLCVCEKVDFWCKGQARSNTGAFLSIKPSFSITARELQKKTPQVLLNFHLLKANLTTLLAMMALSAVQYSVQTFIHNAVLFIDTSNNA